MSGERRLGVQLQGAILTILTILTFTDQKGQKNYSARVGPFAEYNTISYLTSIVA